VTLLIIFAGVALALAAVGLYGVLAFLVTQRSREMAIRLAIGGRPSHVVRGVLMEGLSVTCVGLVAGLGGGYLLARWLQTMLFSVSPSDGPTYLVVTAIMLGVATLAAAIPARRATRVNPVDVLRG